MPIYRITIQRTTARDATVQIEAPNVWAAEQSAEDHAGDYDYGSEYAPEYEITNAERVDDQEQEATCQPLS